MLPSRKESTHTVRGELRAGRREAAGNGGARSVHRGGLDCGLGAGHGEWRTRNIHSMFVTLEVSKLSGWLNADALRNIKPMSVTIEVSKLSGWLNAKAP